MQHPDGMLCWCQWGTFKHDGVLTVWWNLLGATSSTVSKAPPLTSDQVCICTCALFYHIPYNCSVPIYYTIIFRPTACMYCCPSLWYHVHPISTLSKVFILSTSGQLYSLILSYFITLCSTVYASCPYPLYENSSYSYHLLQTNSCTFTLLIMTLCGNVLPLYPLYQELHTINFRPIIGPS